MKTKTYATALGLVAAAGFAGAAAGDANAHWTPAYLSCESAVVDLRQFEPGENSVNYEIRNHGQAVTSGRITRTFAPGQISQLVQVDYPAPLYGDVSLTMRVWWTASDTPDGHSGQTYTGPVVENCGEPPAPEPEPEPTPVPPPVTTPPPVTPPGNSGTTPPARKRIRIAFTRKLANRKRVRFGRLVTFTIVVRTAGNTRGNLSVVDRLRVHDYIPARRQPRGVRQRNGVLSRVIRNARPNRTYRIRFRAFAIATDGRACNRATVRVPGQARSTNARCVRVVKPPKPRAGGVTG